ncbi:MAG TPA: 6-bladed beta-propeller [Bacteroidia bacterium]
MKKYHFSEKNKFKDFILKKLFFVSQITCVIVLFISASSCNVLFKKKSAAKKEVIVYPSSPDQARFQYLTKITTSNDIGSQQSEFSKYILGPEKAKIMTKPYGIAIRNGKIYVCDYLAGGLEILDLEKKKFNFFTPGGLGHLTMPINCFIDEKGYLYIADVGRSQIVVFDENLNYVKSFGLKEQFKPSDVCVYGNKVFVGNTGSKNGNRINVFANDSTNKLLYSIPDSDNTSHSTALGMPANITIYNDKLYAADFAFSMVKAFTLDGKLIDTLGYRGDRPGSFSKLKGVAVDKEENIFAVDAAFDNVQIFNKELKLLMDMGGHSYATGPGRGGMCLPAKVIVDYDNLKYFQKYVDPSFDLKYLVFVTSQYGSDLINVYGRVELKGQNSK